MPNLFGIDIRALVAQTIGPGLVAATLTKVTMGVYNIADPAAGPAQTTATHACRVVQSEWLQVTLKESLVREVRGEVVVILGSMATGVTPSNGDRIAFVDPTGTTRTFTITDEVDVDPAGATATCKVQG